MVAISVAFCASAFADASKNVVVPTKQQVVRKVTKACYVYITGSGIAQPCDRLSVIPTTGYGLDRIGGGHR